MRYLFVMICLVVLLLMTTATASYTGAGGTDPPPWVLVLPGPSMPWMPYSFGGWQGFENYVVQDPSYAKEPILVNSYFADSNNTAGFRFQMINIIGKVRQPFLDCFACGYRGYTQCWYESGFSPGIGFMPSGSSPGYNFGFVNARFLERSNIQQWWLQTDERWADDPYGRNGISTIRAYGCCATCAAMQLKSWGWDVDPGSVVAAMIQYKDGFTGKSGLKFNWDRLKLIYGCGYKKRGVPIQEILDRGMTTQAGVRHDSEGVAGHWIVPYANANKMKSYLVYDTMGRDVVDIETPQYDDPRDDGCWETDTRTLYRKSYDFNLLLQRLSGQGVQGPGKNAVATASVIGPVKVDEEYLKQNLGKVAPCLLPKQCLAQVITLGGGGGTGKGTLSSTLPDEDALVDWEYWGAIGYLAYAQRGDVHLRLKQGSTIVADEQKENNENQITEVVLTDIVLEVSPLKSGDYCLEISGVPGTAFEVQTFQYIQGSSEPVDVMITGTIGASGVYSQSFTQVATALLTDILGLQYIPEGNAFVVVNANVTAKLVTGQYAVQSQYPLVFPWKMTYTGTVAIQEFSRYQMRGIVGANRTIIVDAVAITSDVVNCPPVFRNNRQVFDPVAGCIYTKIAGKIGEISSDYFVIDGVMVKMTPPSRLTSNQTISVCGVANGSVFIASPLTLTQLTLSQ
jgi:hypothetical protein